MPIPHCGEVTPRRPIARLSYIPCKPGSGKPQKLRFLEESHFASILTLRVTERKNAPIFTLATTQFCNVQGVTFFAHKNGLIFIIYNN